MRTPIAVLLWSLTAFWTIPAYTETPIEIENPAIDMESHLRLSLEASEARSTRRLTEGEFIRMAGETDTVVLDARSRDKYDELHVEGAFNLPFPDITVESLERLLPDKNVRVLIYCNNNFVNAEMSFPAKIASASLNLSTYVTLYEYGYRNVFELGPLLDARTTRIAFAGSLAETLGKSR